MEVVVEDDDEYADRVGGGGGKGGYCYYNAVDVRALSSYPPAAQFVSLLLPLGHVKSTMGDDEEFVEHFGNSTKWLRVVRRF